MFDRHFAVWPKGMPKHLVLPETSLYTNLDVSAQRYPDQPAIIYYDSVLSYRQLREQVDALAGALQAWGVEKGDRVLLYMQNAPQFVIAYYAILRANAIVVPINPMNRGAELAHYVRDTQAGVCLCGQEVLERIAPLVGSERLARVVVAAYSDYLPGKTDLALPADVAEPAMPVSGPGLVTWAAALSMGHRPGALLVGPDDLAVFPYSSGTTGAPKGCMHSHRTVMATVVQGALWGGSSRESVTLATLPCFHVAGMQASMNTPIYVGAAMVLTTRWDRHTAARLIERYRVRRWTCIATMVIDLLAFPELDRYDLSSLDNVGGGGAAVPAAVSDKLFERVGLRYMEAYGISETMAGLHINPHGRPKPQCLGIPIFDVDSRIIDPDSGVELGVGEVGEIITHAPQVFLGYWNRPTDTAEAFITLEGKRFFRSGDLGYYDDEGYFFIVDRVKRMINAAGFKVWPAEVESLMYSHPAIQESCVISSPHERRGETVKACVVLADSHKGMISEQDIIKWCKERMAAYKVPHLIEFRDALPRSPVGKVQWRAMQEQEWRGRTRPR